jgi:hypothetical protein
LNFFREIPEEYVGLAHHRADTAHLEHQPLQHQRAALCVRRHQVAGLFRQIDQDCAGLEDGEVAGVAIDDRRNPAVRIDRNEPRLLLFAFQNVDQMRGIGKFEFLERD